MTDDARAETVTEGRLVDLIHEGAERYSLVPMHLRFATSIARYLLDHGLHPPSPPRGPALDGVVQKECILCLRYLKQDEMEVPTDDQGPGETRRQ